MAGSFPFALALSLGAFAIVVGGCMQKVVGAGWFVDSEVSTKIIFRNFVVVVFRISAASPTPKLYFPL